MKRVEFAAWYRGEANACAIENSKKYRKFLYKDHDARYSHVITKDNRRDFRWRFGKADTYWSSSEFYFHVWIVDFCGEKFILLTAKGKGTCIEICDTSYTSIQKKGGVIIRFIEELYTKINPDDDQL